MRSMLCLMAAIWATSTAVAQKKVKPHVPLAVYIMPSQLVPIAYSAGLTGGVEIPVYKQFSITAEYGRYISVSGFMARANLKYYLAHTRGQKEQPYLALEYGYKTQSYQGSDNLAAYPGGQPGPAINYPVYKFVNTVSIKFGRTACYHKWLYTDVYCGVGLRYKVAWNNLTTDQISRLYHWHEGFIESYSNSAGRGFTAALSLGAKIGYRFRHHAANSHGGS